jgi:CRP-like cAMP-binding protein
MSAPFTSNAAKSRTNAPGTAVPAQEILDYIANFATLSAEESQAVVDSMHVRQVAKGTVLLREGQISNLCFFILKGCVRQYYLIDGEEKTTRFYTEGQPITPYEGTFKRTPSKFYLACVEDTLLNMGTEKEEQALYEKFPHLAAISRMAVEEELGKSQESLSNFIISSPEQRYLQLLETRPDLLDRVPQYQLASYLGIKPESLSRIRKRIMGR